MEILHSVFQTKYKAKPGTGVPYAHEREPGYLYIKDRLMQAFPLSEMMKTSHSQCQTKQYNSARNISCPGEGTREPLFQGQFPCKQVHNMNVDGITPPVFQYLKSQVHEFHMSMGGHRYLKDKLIRFQLL